MGRSTNHRLPPNAHAHSPLRYGIPFAKQLDDDGQAEIRIASRRSKRKDKKSRAPSLNSALIDSAVSAGCTCKATIGSRRSAIKSYMFLKRRSDSAKNHPLPKRNSPDILKFEGLGSAPVGWNLTARENLEIGNAVEERGRRPAYIKSRKYLPGLPGKVISAEDPDIVEKSEDSDSFPLQKADAATVMGKESMQMVQGAVPFARKNASDSNAMKCSALCCSCRLSISSFDGEESQLLDVDFWSEDDEFAEAREAIHAPFRRTNRSDNGNRLVLDMRMRFSPARDSKEISAIPSRRGDASSSHAQVQAKLGELIEARGTKIDTRRMNSDAENQKNALDWKERPRIAAASHESGPEITLEEDCSYKNSLPAPHYSGRRLEESSAKDRVTNYEEIPREERKLEKSVGQMSIKSRPQRSATKMASACANGKTRNSKENGLEDVKGKRERRPASAAENVSLKQKSQREKLKGRVSVADDVAVSDAQRKISESLAVVKCSYDPWKDFRDSMVEMIVENEIRDSRDLQELLRCYVSLNSDEYRPMILQVFEQVRSDLSDMIRAV